MAVDASISGTDHRGWFDLIGETEARGKVVPALLYIQVRPVISVTGDADIPRAKIEQTSTSFAIDRFREIPLPAQAIVESEFRCQSPLVLSIVEKALLPFLRISELGLSALECGYIAEQERGKTQTRRSSSIGRVKNSRSPCLGKVVITGAQIVIVEPDEVVQPIAEVNPEFDIVVANLVRPVIHDLILAGILQELCRGGSIFEIAATIRAIAGVVDVELWETAIQRKIAHVCVGNAELISKRPMEVRPVLIYMNAIVAKTKVCKPGWRDNIVAACSDALIARIISTRKAAAAKALPAPAPKYGEPDNSEPK